KIIIDNVLRHRPVAAWLSPLSSLTLLGAACASLLVLAVGSAFLEFIWSAQIARLGQALAFDLRGYVFGFVQRLPISFYMKRSSGEIAHRVTSDIASVQEMFVSVLSVFVVNVLMLAGVALVLVHIDVALGIATLSVCGPLFLLTRFYGRHIKAATR